MPVARRVAGRAQAWDDVPSRVAGDGARAVAVVLLGFLEMAERTHVFVDFGARPIDWGGLLAAASRWPRRERLLVAVAHDLAAPVPAGGAAGQPPATRGVDTAGPGPGRVAVAELVTDLDQYALDRVHMALDLRRGTLTYDEAVERSGGLG